MRFAGYLCTDLSRIRVTPFSSPGNRSRIGTGFLLRILSIGKGMEIKAATLKTETLK